MDSTVALYWLMNPGNNWKVFVANRSIFLGNIALTDKDIADLGSRGASVDKMEKGDWFTGPEWLEQEEK